MFENYRNGLYEYIPQRIFEYSYMDLEQQRRISSPATYRLTGQHLIDH